MQIRVFTSYPPYRKFRPQNLDLLPDTTLKVLTHTYKDFYSKPWCSNQIKTLNENLFRKIITTKPHYKQLNLLKT